MLNKLKKLFALVLIFMVTSLNNTYAYSALYYLKSVKTDDIAPVVKQGFSSQNFSLLKENPFFGVSQNGDESALVILQQSGNNLFYYYQSNYNTKIDKYIVKDVKNNGIICEQSFNQNLIDIYDNLAKDIVANAGATRVYSFEEPTNSFEPPASEQQVQQPTPKPNTYSGYIAQIAAGTKIQCYLQNAINTANASKGDQIIAVVSRDVAYNGGTVIPQGSLIYGSLSKARPATYGSRNGRVVINFNQIVTPENKTFNISTEEIDFTVSNEGKVSEAVKNAAGRAVAGALVGLLFAALSGSDHVLRSAAIGAGVGAGTSAIYSTAEKGVDAEIPSFTELELTLTQPLSATVGY